MGGGREVGLKIIVVNTQQLWVLEDPHEIIIKEKLGFRSFFIHETNQSHCITQILS